MKHILQIKTSNVSTRMPYLPVEGGGLNANYQQVDAVAKICTICGELGLKYNEDFVWSSFASDFGTDHVTLVFTNPEHATLVSLKL